MKAIHLLTLCLCLATFLPHQTEAFLFGCSDEVCKTLDFFSPFCCILQKKCCDKAYENIKTSQPLPQCNSNAAPAPAVANPR
ncbi:hypothetical protein HNY73_002441 [Argiope bruennichi]|uniref:Uncharacterized protein n=1 Tax=Argiope bruennichi TaxID=94029 RepID=A0A8T0FUU1_ARGBR|nr:hypothetical protein HNY73_002441 [Argiope bruennichi]